MRSYVCFTQRHSKLKVHMHPATSRLPMEGWHSTVLCCAEDAHLCSIVHLAELKLDGSLAEAAQSLAQL